MPRAILTQVCAGCGKAFTTKSPKSRWCSNNCRYLTQRGAGNVESLDLASGKIGAISELLVSADLLARGYEVFRSVSQHCSCDLVILKDGRMQRVEVKTGHRAASGAVAYAMRPDQRGKADITAVVILPNAIYYLPELEEAAVA